MTAASPAQGRPAAAQTEAAKIAEERADIVPPPTESVGIRNVSKLFGTTFALEDVTLSIAHGEFFSLLGPSGCGKTTLLRMIGGFETLSQGDILLEGRSVTGVPPYARSTNMIFQHLALFPHLSVFENVAFGMRVRRQRKAEIARVVEGLLDLVRLQGFEGRAIDQLSGGQKQRVALARALANRPSVLLLDEPLGALDLQLRVQMQAELRRLQRELGNTFVFVTHDQSEAMSMSDRIAVMNRGRIEQIGTPEDIYERPRTRFVAHFVGHTNLIDGVVRDGRAGELLVDCQGLGLVCWSHDPLAPGDEVTVALRYENVSVTPGGPGMGSVVVERSFLGGSIRLTVQTDRGLQLVADVPRESAARSVMPGERVSLSCPGGQACALKR